VLCVIMCVCDNVCVFVCVCVCVCVRVWLQAAAVPVTHISNIKQINVDEDALFYIDDPDPRWRNFEDCGAYTC